MLRALARIAANVRSHCVGCGTPCDGPAVLPSAAPASRARQERLDKVVMFVDICSSTKLYETLGDDKAFALIATCLTRIARLIRGSGGVVVKEMGDGIMATFDRACVAIETARMIRRSPCHRGIRVHTGIHAGPVLMRHGDIFGRTVNITARVAAMAAADQILVTGDVVADLPDALCSQMHPVRHTMVRGSSQAITIYEVPETGAAGAAGAAGFDPMTLGEPFYGLEMRKA